MLFVFVPTSAWFASGQSTRRNKTNAGHGQTYAMWFIEMEHALPCAGSSSRRDITLHVRGYMSMTKEPSGGFTAKLFLPVPDGPHLKPPYIAVVLCCTDTYLPLDVHACTVSFAGLPSSGPASPAQYRAVLGAWEGVAAR